MKSQICFVAMGLILATTALGFATVGHVPPFRSHETTPIQVSQSTPEPGPRRVYCYSGLKGEPGKLYRGWVCETADSPALTTN
jgi:hypothetical protein